MMVRLYYVTTYVRWKASDIFQSQTEDRITGPVNYGKVGYGSCVGRIMCELLS